MITRRELKAKLGYSVSSGKAAIEGAPLRAFVTGIILGALLVSLRSYIYLVAVVFIICLGGIWLFADDGDEPKAAATLPPEHKTV